MTEKELNEFVLKTILEIQNSPLPEDLESWLNGIRNDTIVTDLVVD